uniref:Pectinesterase inhibitor domain-containing protein n=1 Tax=Cucumis melo TaxID=3656 RepID=A0A9I9DKK3_CUCME
FFSLLQCYSSHGVDTTTTSNDVASSIYSKTRNPSLCANVLKSRGNPELKVLATYTLKLTCTNAKKYLNLAKSLAATTTNSQVKN